MRVQHLQHHRLLELAYHLGPGLLLLGLVLGEHGVMDALAQRLLVQVGIVVEPLLDVGMQGEVGLERLAQAADVP